METLLIQLIPLVIPIGVLFAKRLVAKLPKKHIPTIVGVLGLLSGLVTGGTDVQIVDMISNMLGGGTVALAGIGVHQLKKQIIDKSSTL